MTSYRFTMALKVWIPTFVFTLLLANPEICSAKKGGLDGSGGNVLNKKSRETLKILQEEWLDLPLRLRLMETIVNNEDEFIYDYRFGKSAFSIMRAFFSKEKKNILSSSIEQKKIRLIPQYNQCQTANGFHDAKAIGSPDKGTICISIKKIDEIKEGLRKDVFALLIHELSHLVGFDEIRAKQIQVVVANNLIKLCDNSPRVGYAFPNGGMEEFLAKREEQPSETLEKFKGYSQGFNKECNKEDIEKKRLEFLNSPYWQRQTSILLKLLSQKGDVDLAEKFAYGVSLLEFTPKFNKDLIFEKYEAREFDIRISPVEMSFDDYKNVASFDITTPSGNIKGRLGGVIAKGDTNAMCSYKHLLASRCREIGKIAIESPFSVFA